MNSNTFLKEKNLHDSILTVDLGGSVKVYQVENLLDEYLKIHTDKLNEILLSIETRRNDYLKSFVIAEKKCANEKTHSRLNQQTILDCAILKGSIEALTETINQIKKELL